jgi:asparagine synthase (glutamine-hydrolysing)
MANSLEERFPFLDNDLVDFAQKIPVRHKLSNLNKEIRRIDENTPQKKKAYREFSDGKNVLRKAMRDFIPETILNRKKQGFSAPDESWYRGESARYVKETLLNKHTASTEFIKESYIKTIIEEHMEQKKNHRLLIWSMLCFEWWVKIFMLNEPFDKQNL